MNKKELIESLIKLQATDPSKNFSAGFKPNRASREFTNKTVLHNSIDLYKGLNKEAQGLDKRYVRKSSGNTKTIIVCPDIHDEEVDPFYLKCLLRAAEIVQPDIVNFAGDTFDCAEFGSYANDPRDFDPAKKMKFVHENVFEPLRNILPDAQFDALAGNHEERLIKHMLSDAPAVMAVLDELHGFTMGKFFGLDKYQINFYAKNDFTAHRKTDINKEIARNTVTYFDRLLIDHFPTCKHTGIPAISGHHHKFIVEPKYNHTFGSYSWCQSGGGHERDASYCNGEIWQLGFVIANIHIPSNSVVFDYVDCTHNMAVIAGEFLYRD